jgi:hypothetical protein
LRTLAHKQKCSNQKILDSYGKEIKTTSRHNKEISFISSVEVSNMKKEFLIKNVNNPYTAISRSFINLQKKTTSVHNCAIKNCNETEDIEVHHIQKLYRNVDKNNRVIVKDKSRKISKLRAMEFSLKRKHIPLCFKHYRDWHNGNLSKSDFKVKWV